MKRLTVLTLSLILFSLLTFKMWPSQSNVSKAFSMARTSCGLSERNGSWEFSKNSPLVNFRNLTDSQRKVVENATEEHAVLAQRAALLDTKWVQLAGALSVVHIDQTWGQSYTNSGDYGPYVTDSKIKVLYICKAIREESNS